MFEEWNEVKKAFSASAPRMRAVVGERASNLECWPLWASVALTLAVAAYAPFAYAIPLGSLVILLSTGLCMIALILSRELLAMVHFHDLYRRHAITSQPLLKRETFLRYALFLQRLEHSNMTAEQASRLTDFAKKSVIPSKSLNLSQSVVMTILMTLLCSVGLEVLKSSSVWEYGHGRLVVIALTLLFLICLFIKVLFSDLAHYDTRLIHFMEWASRDLEQNPDRFTHDERH